MRLLQKTRLLAFTTCVLLLAAIAAAQPALEAKHTAVIEAFADRFGLPGFSKEEGQAWVARLASTFKAKFPQEGWGTKRASPTRPLSNESIARPAGGRLWSYDLIIGAGAPGQHLEARAHPEDISDQVFVEVDAFDHLGSGQPGPGPGKDPPITPPPVSGTDLGPVLTEIRAIQQLHQQNLTALLALAQSLSALQAAIEEIKAHDLVTANELRITRAELLAAAEKIRADVARGIRVRF
jgi:hypothetical protein